MDFALHFTYTEEQEQFRQEVRAWLEENVPEEMKSPIDPRDNTPEMYWFWREKQVEMGKKGWLYPTYPKEYGGGGLTPDHEMIIDEEFGRARARRGFSSTQSFPTLLVWATEEQKQKFLRPLLTGEKVTWQKLTEPHAGSDLADYQSRAIRDGDEWVLSGSNVFVGDGENADMMIGPMLTDPDSPRHRNLGYFVIPIPLPGLEIRVMNLLEYGRKKRAIFMDNVRVPFDHLIGSDHQGWQVMGTHLEAEHGGRGVAFPRDRVVDSLLEYVKETNHNGESLGSDPVLQQVTMDAYIESNKNRLLAQRTYWMYQNHMKIGNESAVYEVSQRMSGLRNSIRVRDVMGMHTYLNTYDPRVSHGGVQEIRQRADAGQHHIGGTNNVAKLILARRIGISRTRETTAPTPSTATTGGS